MLKSAKTLTVSSDFLSDLSKSCLWILTDSGPQIEFGHLKRTMTLARSLNDCILPLFLIDPQDRWSREKLADQGMAFVCEPLESVWAHIPDPQAILIDTGSMAGLDGFIKEAKKRNLTVISIHEFDRRPNHSDIAIDSGIASCLSEFQNQNTEYYSGTSYMILDPVYRLMHQQEKRIADRIRTVFINLGGKNSGHIFKKLLEGLRLWNRELEVFGASDYSSWVRESLSRRDWAPLHFQWCREPVGAYCFQADIAITAGGMVAYESICAGTPLLALSLDDFQNTTIQILAHEGACMGLGSGEDFTAASLPHILSCIESDREKRRLFSDKGRNIVDGRGVERVSQIIRESIGSYSSTILLKSVG